MNAYLFDVDGVLNNIEHQTISESEIVFHLIELLKNGTPLGFISGRGMPWLKANVIRTLEKCIKKIRILIYRFLIWYMFQLSLEE